MIYALYVEAGYPRLEDLAAMIARDGRLDGVPKKDVISRIVGKGGPAQLVDINAVAMTLAHAAGRPDVHEVAAEVRRRCRADVAVPSWTSTCPALSADWYQ